MEALIFTLILICLIVLIKRAANEEKNSTNHIKKLENRLKETRVKINKIKGTDIEDYPGSPQYQALLRKYNGNIPGSGQGDNSGEKMGKRGGRYIKRVSKKTGKPYRHYY